ncbi:MAG: DUF3536 domain-containing protein [bacterium]|jgi:alpha-amylase/alpha-mannosidase (GH57 family)
MNKYICIHGHFYQPPRENPWLETIELQDSAYPYHDWNERVTAECYAPNSASRILSGDGFIEQIVNNYTRISFNFGPTLIAWMKAKASDIYEALLAADRESQKLFGGHGNAIAQVYNHMILPLGNTRDKYTQIHWGVRDFETRFARKPEGMWLAETAVDLETLDLMAEHDIKFTILSPYQAHNIRKIGDEEWTNVTGANIDPTRVYKCHLPSGNSIAIFFYDGPISQGIAFERLLSNGEHFANRLIGAFSDERDGPQLVHIATDGETYGHHHHQGDMGLAYALNYIDNLEDVSLINYGYYLEKFPPTYEVEIYENTAWSCAHGVGRWQDDCGCNTGGHGNWNQKWRKPLREALDWLRDAVTPLYETLISKYIREPWEARDEYIEVILDRSDKNLDRYFSRFIHKPLTDAERVVVLELLELQRHAMLMYTSCGWFFDELSGIETVQVIQYAGRVIQLAEKYSQDPIEEEFLKRLELARSNIPQYQNGRVIYEKFVKPAMVDLPKVAAHFALSSIFEQYEEKTSIFHYHIEIEDYQLQRIGDVKLVVGRVRVTSEITHDSGPFSFGAIYMGDHNLYGGVRLYQGEEEYERLVTELKKVFESADFPETIHQLDRSFGEFTYSLRQLFHDEQRKIIDTITLSTMERAVSLLSQLYEPHVPLMSFLADVGIPQPVPLHNAAEFVINARLRKQFEREEMDFERVRSLLNEAQKWQLNLEQAGLGHVYKNSLERIAEKFHEKPDSKELLALFLQHADLINDLPFSVNLWKVQNRYYDLLKNVFPANRKRAERSKNTREWCRLFEELGKKLLIAR